MKKIVLVLSVLTLIFLVVSCSTVSGIDKSSNKEFLLVVSNNREDEQVILAGEDIVFTLDSLLQDVSDKDIIWYVNGEKFNQTGKTITVTTDKDVNIQYSAHVEINTPSFKGTSNYSRCIAVVDLAYKDLALSIYKYAEETRNKYHVENIPGMSISLYGRNGDIDFNLYDGYASVSKGIKNTEETFHMIGSISKTFVASSFVKLMLEDGSTLSMDQTIGGYLTEEDLDPEHTGQIMDKLSLDVTLGSLMNHTSGIDDFMGTPFVMDLIHRDKSQPIYNIIGLILNKRLPEDPYKNGWAPNKILKNILSEYNPERGYTYSTPGYIILGMVVEKYLSQTHPGMTLSDYVNENFVLPFCDERVILLASEFDDDSDYDVLAEPNVYQGELDDLIRTFTAIDPKLVKILGINKEGKEVFSFNDFITSYSIVMAQSVWAGGAFAAKSHQIARYGYNLLGLNVENPTNKEVRDLITQNLGTDDFVNDRTYCYFRMNVNESEDEPDVYLFGHNGKTASVSNVMMYDPQTDICISVLIDSNAPEESFKGMLKEIHYMYL